MNYQSNKPFAESCEENKEPILQVLRPLFRDAADILEIGSGTGQHAVWFAGAMPHLRWHTSELSEHHAGIRRWIADSGLTNVAAPLTLDVSGDWPEGPYEGAFSANTAHIMHWEMVEAMFRGLGRVLAPGAPFALYGPFNYGGRFTSESNARFDQWLKQRDAQSGVRDFEALNELARQNGMSLLADHEMPVNNRTLVWRKNP